VSRIASDADLIQRCINGDPLAERALYDRHVDAVYRTAYRISGDAEAAADYTQDTFVKAFARLQQFNGASPFGAWLRAITASTALTGEPKRVRYRGSEDPDRLADHGATTARFELIDGVQRALDAMPERLRSVFLMHDIEGYTHDEIGAALGIPSGTSRARLSEARSRLRVVLAEYREERAS
jgi:RNA polymerase sigma-70 factor (ECF subfamily)